MDFEITMSLLLTGAFLGFLCGYLPQIARINKLKKKPLTYYECLNIPNGTEVSLLQFGCNNETEALEHGTVCTLKNGHKCIDVYDRDIEFTEADVWIDN